MNRFALAILTLAIALGGPASAGIISPYGNPELNTNVVAGQVSSLGIIERGAGFRVQLNGDTYEITFERRYFPSGCAALVVSPSAPLLPVVAQNHCGDKFFVTFYQDNKVEPVQFQFVAREDAPQHP
jgi:hypothetical protein